jgi:hypothetical protein
MRIDLGTVARDHLDARMLSQPSGEGLRFPVGQHVHDAVLLQVHQQCAVGVTPTTGPVIDAQHAGSGRRGRLCTTNQTQHRVGAGRGAQVREQARGGLAPQGHGDAREGLGQPRGASRVGRHQLAEALGEQGAWAARMPAAKASHAQREKDREAPPREVRKRSGVDAVDPPRG